MGRPRQHDLDELLEHARQLWIDHGIAGVTVRALITESGASNGAVYHAFGSRDGLLARVWTREAEKFLAFQRKQVERALQDSDPVSALVAAALSPASYAVEDEDGARLLLTTNADKLMTPELDANGHTDLLRLQQQLGELLTELATVLWERRDRAAVTTVRYCVVNLPGSLLLKSRDVSDPVAQHALEQAVRGIASAPPPTNTRPTKNNPATKAQPTSSQRPRMRRAEKEPR